MKVLKFRPIEMLSYNSKEIANALKPYSVAELK